MVAAPNEHPSLLVRHFSPSWSTLLVKYLESVVQVLTPLCVSLWLVV